MTATLQRTPYLVVTSALLIEAALAQGPVPEPSHSAPASPPGQSAGIGEGSLLDTDSARLSFQALLTDAAGEPLPGPTVSLAFNVYTAGGVLVDAVAARDVGISEGVVSTQIPVDAAAFNGEGRLLEVVVDGEVKAPRIPLTASPYALRVDRVASKELDDHIELGAEGTSGSLAVWSSTGAVPTVAMGGDGESGAGATMALGTVAGEVTIFANAADAGANGASLHLRDDNGEDQVVITASTSGGRLSLSHHAGGAAVPQSEISGVNSPFTGATLLLRDFDQDRVRIGARDGQLLAPQGGGFLSLYNDTSQTAAAIRVDADTSNNGGPAEIEMTNTEENPTVVLRSMQTGTDSGWFALQHGTNGQVLFEVNGEEGDGGSALFMRNGDPSATQPVIELDSREGSNAALLRLRRADGNRTVELVGNEALDDGGQLTLWEADQTPTITLDAEHSTTDQDHPGGALMTLANQNGAVTISIDANDNTLGGGRIWVENDQSSYRVLLQGQDANGAGLVGVRDEDGNTTIRMKGAERAGEGAQIDLMRADGMATMTLDADIQDGAEISLRNGAGDTTIRLDANNGANGVGFIVTDVLQINGGADLSERFDIRTSAEELEPGMVVSIDSENPGKLVISQRAYDPTVAGIVSGAGGVSTGMLMGQTGSAADGQHPVALTGRVYCLVDATQASVRPGDLLTTSDTPGYAMRVLDHDRARGAIIGKAMTGLEEGRGLVLVLVSLQ